MIAKRYEALQERVDALSLRERAIIFIGIAALLYFAWDSLLMVPSETRQQRLLGQIETLRGQLNELDSQTSEVMARQNIDPDREERQQLAALEQQIAQIDRQIGDMVSGLIEPEQMADILESMLQQQEGLTFIRLENLGREALVDVAGEAANADTSGIYRHTMRLELEGSFNQTLAYLRALETLPWQFRWDEVEITMLDYPRANIVIKVHTLSLQEGWVGV